MRLEEVRERLAEIPTRLPALPSDLIPTVLAGPDGTPGARPEFPDLPRREAAVLILFHADARGDAVLVLTERSPGGHRHAGQISLPGGAVDPSDASAAAAALREAHEEIGLDIEQAGVEVHGVLPAVDVRVSGFLVHPVIALAQRAPILAPDGYEVAAVFSAPVAAFLPGAPVEIVTAERDGYRLRYGAFRVGERLVWGATAGILGRLGAFLAGEGR